MFCDSSTGSCKSTEKIWGVISNSNDKTLLHRLTFSKSLADLITTYDNKYKVQEFEFAIGKKLLPGETSSTKLYGLIATKGDYVLRVSLIKEISELHCDNDSRYLSEVYLRPII